jgi:hypothetical protein
VSFDADDHWLDKRSQYTSSRCGCGTMHRHYPTGQPWSQKAFGTSPRKNRSKSLKGKYGLARRPFANAILKAFAGARSAGAPSRSARRFSSRTRSSRENPTAMGWVKRIATAVRSAESTEVGRMTQTQFYAQLKVCRPLSSPPSPELQHPVHRSSEADSHSQKSGRYGGAAAGPGILRSRQFQKLLVKIFHLAILFRRLVSVHGRPIKSSE